MSGSHQRLETYFFVGTCLEGFFWGLYTAIFAMHVQHHIMKEGADKKKNIIFYSHCALYVLSGSTFAADIAWFAMQYFHMTPADNNILYYVIVTTNVLYGCCNFLSQSILIYRCWIVWSGNIYVVIIPLILTLAFLPIWLTSIGSSSVSHNQLTVDKWGWRLISTSLCMSLAVNAVVTSLILFRIIKVYWEVEPILYEKLLGTTGGGRFRSIVLAIIESAVVLLALQMVLVVCGSVATESAGEVGNLTIGMHQMLLGIAPTIIQVRVSMGLSFHDESTIIDSGVTRIHFVPGDGDSTLELSRIVHREPESGGNYVEETKR